MTATAEEHYDIVIIGTGAGGGAVAHALRDTRARVLVLERGDFLPREPDNWNPDARGKYSNSPDLWTHGDASYPSLENHFVGGMTKLYGAALPRFREQDFRRVEFPDGVSPAWPFGYDTLAPYYHQAEVLYRVHGRLNADLTDPPRSEPFPFPEVPHGAGVDTLLRKISALGLHPVHLPIGLDVGETGRCQRCGTCDGFPCMVDAKSDADVCCIRPLLQRPNFELRTKARAHRLVTDPSGQRVVGVEIEHDGKRSTVSGDLFVVACGAVNSPALLLKSASKAHPDGLANSSGLVGRNLMMKNATFVVATHPEITERSGHQKTWGVHDYYHGGSKGGTPLGVIQAIGKVDSAQYKAWGLAGQNPGVSVDSLALTECLPDPENRVTLNEDGGIRFRFERNNVELHRQLVEALVGMLRDIGSTRIETWELPADSAGKARLIPAAHLCGTIPFGSDPKTSVLDESCRTRDVDNLYVVDASIFPSQSSLNPALTIIATALRAGDKIKQKGLS